MKQIEIQGNLRAANGKKATKAMRREGLVPCNIYGVNKDAEGNATALSFSINEKDANKLVFTPNIYLVKLSIDGEEKMGIIREIQFHPVKDNVLHIDFLEVTAEKPIVVGIPIQTTGLAEGVRAGGKLTQLVRKINVKALYENIPEKLVIDVAHLKLGKTIKVGDLQFENLELVTPKEVNVIAVQQTRAAQSASANATEESEEE